MVQLLWKHVLQILTKLNRHLPYDPEILFTDIFPREGEMNVYINVCLYKALYKNVAILLIIAKDWKQSKCAPQGREFSETVVHSKRGIPTPQQSDK